MILLLGATTYVGQGFARALRRRRDSFIPLSQNALDYTRFEFLFDYVRKIKPEFLINAEEKEGKAENGKQKAEMEERSAGVMERWSDGGEAESGKLKAEITHHSNTPSLHHSNTPTLHHSNTPPLHRPDIERMEMFQANTLLPQTIARVCDLTRTPWAHVSSGSIYAGAKILENGGIRIERDLCRPEARRFLEAHPERVRGFTELDEPNYSFKDSCNFYSGTKALAEEAVRSHDQSYIWRFHLPFNELDEPRNFLSQLQDAYRLHDVLNSLSHLDECVGACLDLWERRGPFGAYNVVNPGAASTHEVLKMVQRILKPARPLQLLVYDDDGANGHDGNNGNGALPECLLDSSKLLRTGIKLANVQEALERALRGWEGAGERMKAEG